MAIAYSKFATELGYALLIQAVQRLHLPAAYQRQES